MYTPTCAIVNIWIEPNIFEYNLKLSCTDCVFRGFRNTQVSAFLVNSVTECCRYKETEAVWNMHYQSKKCCIYYFCNIKYVQNYTFQVQNMNLNETV